MNDSNTTPSAPPPPSKFAQPPPEMQQRFPWRRRALVVAAVLLLAGGAALLYQLEQRGVPANRLMLSGNIEAHESLVSFKDIQSKITELPFDEGQWVKKGQLLAQVDDSNYRQQVVIAEATLLARRADLASAHENLLAARRTVQLDRATMAQRRADYDRYQQLWRHEVISTQTRDQAFTAYKESVAALQRDQAMVGVAQKNIAVAEANVKNAQDSLHLAWITLGYTRLLAPFSGVIVVRDAELGEAVQPGTPIVTLADLDHVWLRAYVSETDLGKVRYGQPAVITTDSYPGKEYPGRISFISSQAEFTPKSVETHEERVTLVYRIKIDVANPKHELKPGMPADAVIFLGAQPATRSGDGQSVIHGN